MAQGHSVGQGAVFVGHNENSGKRWTTKCTVTDAEPGRVFAFDVRHTVFPIARWQYDIEPRPTAAAGSPRAPGTAGPVGFASSR